VDNDGWNHVSREGRLASDLLTVHVYTPDRHVWAERHERLTQGSNFDVAVEPLVVGETFFPQPKAGANHLIRFPVPEQQRPAQAL